MAGKPELPSLVGTDTWFREIDPEALVHTGPVPVVGRLGFWGKKRVYGCVTQRSHIITPDREQWIEFHVLSDKLQYHVFGWMLSPTLF